MSDRSGSEGAERSHRSEATKLSGAQMPEQHRAGQLVIIYNNKVSLKRIAR